MSQIDLLAERVQEALLLHCHSCGNDRAEYRDTKTEFAIYAEQDGWFVGEDGEVYCSDCEE